MDESVDIRHYVMTSPKFKKFVSELMRDKDIEEVCGIDETSALRLRDGGWTKAYVILGQFLLLNKDKELFINWLYSVSDVDILHGRIVYECIKEWCNLHL